MNPKSSRNLASLESIEFDLVIVGGGITGAGIARHAAKCGLKVALLEANDFASGTSSKSSKLIHGGLRYLAMGDIALVRETALERKKVHQMAPHLAEPAWMVLPVRSQAGLLKFRAGLGVYERLGAVANTDRHQNLNKLKLAEFEPGLDRDHYPLACAYREYLTDDARLVMAVLRAAQSEGAIVANYAEVLGLELKNDNIVGINVRCKISSKSFHVKTRVVVNAAGPWVEHLIENWEGHKAKVGLHLSKGVHVAVPHEKLPVKNIVVMNTQDKRSLFVIPRGDVSYIGTTDTSYSGSPTHWPEVQQADVDYLLDVIPEYFPQIKLTRKDVVSAWAGLRPLVHEPGKSSRELSRKDEIWVSDATGMISMAGGKLTGFRKMAEEAMNVVGNALGYDLDCKNPMSVLPGGEIDNVDTAARELSDNLKLKLDNATRLIRLYGSEAAEVIALDDRPVVNSSRIFTGEIEWALQRESAMRLEDVIYRRLRMALYEPREVAGVLEPVAELMAEYLNWSDQEMLKQIGSVRQLLTNDLAFST